MDEFEIEEGRLESPSTLLCAKVGALVERDSPNSKFVFITCDEDGCGTCGHMDAESLAKALYGLIHKSNMYRDAVIKLLHKIQAEA